MHVWCVFVGSLTYERNRSGHSCVAGAFRKRRCLPLRLLCHMDQCMPTHCPADRFCLCRQPSTRTGTACCHAPCTSLHAIHTIGMMRPFRLQTRCSTRTITMLQACMTRMHWSSTRRCLLRTHGMLSAPPFRTLCTNATSGTGTHGHAVNAQAQRAQHAAAYRGGSIWCDAFPAVTRLRPLRRSPHSMHGSPPVIAQQLLLRCIAAPLPEGTCGMHVAAR